MIKPLLMYSINIIFLSLARLTCSQIVCDRNSHYRDQCYYLFTRSASVNIPITIFSAKATNYRDLYAKYLDRHRKIYLNFQESGVMDFDTSYLACYTVTWDGF